MTRATLSTLLDAYVLQEALFERRPGPDGVAPVDHLARHLRQQRARGEVLPTDFTTHLKAALGRHGVTDLEPTPAQEGALLRLLQAHGALELSGRILLTALSTIVRDDHSDATDEERGQLRDRLERFAALAVHRDRGLAEAAYTALYLLCDQPRQLAEARELGRASAEAFRRLVAPAATEADRSTAHAVLDQMPHGTLLSLIPEWLQGSAAGADVLLELLVRRLHPEATCLERSGMAALFRTSGGRVLALLGRAEGIVVEAARALAVLGSIDDGGPLDIDAFISEPSTAELARLQEAGSEELSAMLPGAVRRFSANWGNVELGRLSRTFERTADGRLTENRSLRDLHPARIEASELARLSEFELEVLPAPGEVFLALARARQDPTDERLVCIVEVERIDPERDPATGAILRVPSFERVYMTALHAMRVAQHSRANDQKLFWNRLVIFVRPLLTMPREELETITRRLTAPTVGLTLEKVVVLGRVPSTLSPEGQPVVIEWTNPTGHGATITITEPTTKPVRSLTAHERRIVEARRKGLFYPYELIRHLASKDGHGSFPRGSFVELDLDETGERLVPVSRPYGQNTAYVVAGLLTNHWHPFEDGLRRVLLVGDPTRGMGSLAEPECRRILAAFDLAEREELAVEWVTVSSGAKIAMDSGTENLDWTARVLARIVRFTQAGGTVNVIVDGVNVGAQSYWNAEATMLMHCKGALIMTPQGSMLLTGKKALEFAGSVSAEDNNGIGGFERIMGPNGEAQYFAPDLTAAYGVLFRHLAFTQRPPGEPRLRPLQTTDPRQRDVSASPYGHGGEADGYTTVGEIFDETTNPGRKKPFRIRPVMKAVLDRDIEPLERWAFWQGAESAVVWEGALGGDPVCCIGIESRPVPRRGELPADGPDHWTSGTLFPLSSKKVARAINAASGVRPVVVLANLSGFDGSPDSLRNLQLEYGAEIGRAVVNFQGPLVFCVVSRYHGGAYVVFSQALNPSLNAFALKGSYASVIGGGPAAAVVFPGLVKKRAEADPAVLAARRALESASATARVAATAEYERVLKEARARAQQQVAREFDAVHTVERAQSVGSLSAVLPLDALRAQLITRIRGDGGWVSVPAADEPQLVASVS